MNVNVNVNNIIINNSNLIKSNVDSGNNSSKLSQTDSQIKNSSTKNIPVITLPHLNNIKTSTSPDSIKTSPNNKSQTKVVKGLNIIPIKNLNSNREAIPINTTNYFSNNHNNSNDKISSDRFSPKPKDIKITASNMSPKSKMMPLSSRNNVGFDSTKYSNKIYANITNNLMHKSPSPKHSDLKNISKKSPEVKK